VPEAATQLINVNLETKSFYSDPKYLNIFLHKVDYTEQERTVSFFPAHKLLESINWQEPKLDSVQPKMPGEL